MAVVGLQQWKVTENTLPFDERHIDLVVPLVPATHVDPTEGDVAEAGADSCHPGCDIPDCTSRCKTRGQAAIRVPGKGEYSQICNQTAVVGANSSEESDHCECGVELEPVL